MAVSWKGNLLTRKGVKVTDLNKGGKGIFFIREGLSIIQIVFMITQFNEKGGHPFLGGD